MFPREWYPMFCSVSRYKDYCLSNVCTPHLRPCMCLKCMLKSHTAFIFHFTKHKRETESESAGSEICGVWYKNITKVLTVNSQQQGSEFESPQRVFCEVFTCSHVCRGFFLGSLTSSYSQRHPFRGEVNWWFWMDLKCVCVCEWLLVSVLPLWWAGWLVQNGPCLLANGRGLRLSPQPR